MKASTLAVVASITGAVFSVGMPFEDAAHSPEAKSLIPLVLSVAVAALAALMGWISLKQARSAKRQKQVLMIYGPGDLDVARDLADVLRTEGYSPWLDSDQILPGETWKVAVDEAVRSSNAAVVILSEKLNQSESALKELKAAIEIMSSANEGVSPIIPVKVDESSPPDLLGGVAWADMRNPDGLERLLKGLELASSKDTTLKHGAPA